MKDIIKDRKMRRGKIRVVVLKPVNSVCHGIKLKTKKMIESVQSVMKKVR